MTKRLLYILSYFFAAVTIAATALTFVGCSSTELIPEGEQLYLGQKGISYARQTADTMHHDAHDRAAEKAALALAKEEVEAALAYEPNGSFLGSSTYAKPWKFGLWVHNRYADRERGFGHWLNSKFGEQPVLISTVAPQTRTKIATNTLHNYGYFRGKVDYNIVESRDPKAARIHYDVTTGPVIHLDSVEYRSFGPTADSLLQVSKTAPLLRRGDAFSVLTLTDEQNRIADVMRNNGYYYWIPSYTSFQADTIARPGHVQLRVLPKSSIPTNATYPWIIGKTYVSIRDRQNSPLDHSSTMRRGGFELAWNGPKIPAKNRLWRGAISHRRGRPYRADDQTSTLSKLSALGILSSVDVAYTPRDTTDSCNILDVYVDATMGRLYDTSFEVNTTLKSSQQLGPGVRYELAKRNAFRGGETVAWDIFGSYEWQLGRRQHVVGGLLNSFELGSSLKMEIPRFVFPWIINRRLRFPASTTFAFETDWKNRSGFFQMLNVGANVSYNWQRRRFRYQWDLLDLDYYRLSHTSESFQEILDANPAIYASMRNIFVPSMGFSAIYASSAGETRPVWLQMTVKEGSALTDGLHRLCNPHHDNSVSRTLLGTPYAQFVKATAEAHYTLPLTSSLQLATRGFGGVIASYGNGEAAPYSEQFYIGGANSIRAFTVRTAGPGGYRTDNSKYAYLDQTGDFKLEANAELRAHLFGGLNGAVFLDAGNVWLLRKDPLRPGAELSAANLRRIAFGTGVGVRYDLDFLVLRFDVGIGLHAPYDTTRGGFYNFERFRDGVAYHFAIGYPF